MKLFLKRIFIICFSFFVCSGLTIISPVQRIRPSINIEKVELIVRMNGSCTFQYTVNKKGTGILMCGKSNNYENEIFKFVEIQKVVKIKIKDKKNSEEFETLVNKIDSTDSYTGTQNADAWHCVLLINDLKRIDVYGTLESKDLYRLIQLLATSKKTKLDPKCCARTK